MPDPVDALVTFHEAYEQDGLGPDGLPLYRTVVMITKAKPPLLEVTAVATEEDIAQFHEPYRMFELHRASRHQAEGYPLVLWPVCGPAELKMLAVRDITTVEQLAQLANRREGVLPQIIELAKRAKQMMQLQKEHGKYEAIITELNHQRDELAEQLREANATISAQNSMIARLQQQPVPARVA